MKKFLGILALALFLPGTLIGSDNTFKVRALSIGVSGGDEILVATSRTGIDGKHEFAILSGMENGEFKTAYAEVRAVEAAVISSLPSGTCVFYSTEGKTWCSAFQDGNLSSPVFVGEGICFGQPLIKEDALILPMFIPSKGVFLMTSKDGGKHFNQAGSPVRIPGKIQDNKDNPSLILTKAGDYKLVCRSCGTAFAWETISADGGRTWSEPCKSFENPDLDFSLTALSDSRTLLVKNAKIDNHVYAQPRGLYAYLSDDSGLTWWGGLCLNSSWDGTDPKVALTARGRIYIAYTAQTDTESSIKLSCISEKEIDSSTPWASRRASASRTIYSAPLAKKHHQDELAGLTAQKTDWSDIPLRVATYNIQYPVPQCPWDKRIGPLVKLIRQYDWDLFGAQEPYLPQIEDLMAQLGDTYAWIGTCISEDNTSRTRHFNPIFYRKDRLELLEWDTVFYSESPATPGYGAFSARLMTWAKFRDKLSGKVFYHFNSHMDHRGVEAMEISAGILVDCVRKIAAGMPAFMTGDFNSTEDTEVYRIMVSNGFIKDSMLAVPNPVNSEYFSMSHYRPMDTVAKSGKHIDHVFFTPNSSKVLSWKLITDSYDGYFGSDHLPIMIEWLVAN